MFVLGIESSCDETAASIVNEEGIVLSSVVASQVPFFESIGGKVPEVAARLHSEKILADIDQAVVEAGVPWEGIRAVAVTEGPGLVGSLLVGHSTAKGLAFARGKKIVWVDHLRAHILAVLLRESNEAPLGKLAFPALALLVSGGHTELLILKTMHDWQVIGRTRDDAVGEAFDKVGRMLGLPYPGGPNVSEQARRGNRDRFRFPVSLLEEGSLDFSFSGLKTAVLREVRRVRDSTVNILHENFVEDVSASFEKAVIVALMTKTQRAIQQQGIYLEDTAGTIKSIVLAGGVAANRRLRSVMRDQFKEQFVCPQKKYCTDNAAMVAICALVDMS